MKSLRKPKGAYHHPDLASALVEAALRTIAEEGLEALTLRGVGARLNVSRTALYRHFEDKAALIARVKLEGFRKFRRQLRDAVDRARQQRRDPMDAMGQAYIAFALDNPSHYKTMFGGVPDDNERFPDMVAEAQASFAVLFETIQAEQRSGTLPNSDTHVLASVIWSQVHGIATLAMAGHIPAESVEEVRRVAWHRWRHTK